jgi:hypothetical protein
MEVAGANAGWRWQFRFAVHGFWSGVAQLFSLGIKIGLRFYRVGWSGEDRE